MIIIHHGFHELTPVIHYAKVDYVTSNMGMV